MSIGARLKKLRLQNEESLQAVADAVGASKAHIWELEVGRSRNPSVDLLKKIAEHFRVTVGSLLGEDTSSTEEELELMAMFRDLKELEQGDRDIIAGVMATIKKNRESRGEKD